MCVYVSAYVIVFGETVRYIMFCNHIRASGGIG